MAPHVGERHDPLRGFHFRLEIPNTSSAGFSECSGLTAEVGVVEYREGIDPPFPHKLPALSKFSNIVLKRGFTSNLDLYNWYLSALNGAVERRDGAIVLQDEAGADVLRWNFFEGWISKYEGATLNASNNEVAVETCEICVERVQLEAA